MSGDMQKVSVDVEGAEGAECVEDAEGPEYVEDADGVQCAEDL